MKCYFAAKNEDLKKENSKKKTALRQLCFSIKDVIILNLNKTPWMPIELTSGCFRREEWDVISTE